MKYFFLERTRNIITYLIKVSYRPYIYWDLRLKGGSNTESKWIWNASPYSKSGNFLWKALKDIFTMLKIRYLDMIYL